MGLVSEFERELIRRSKSAYGKWFKIDLHNHGPQSFDYKYKDAYVEDIVAWPGLIDKKI